MSLLDRSRRMHAHRRPGSPCAACGFDATLAPSDAVVAIRSFPRRYRKLLHDALLDPERGDELIRFRPEGGWSALELAAHVRDALHIYEKRIQRTVHEESPTLADAELETPPTDAHDQGPELVLAALLANADRFAHTAQGVMGDDWLRRATVGTAQVSALDLLREAVHDGAHHLRDVERVLDLARASV